MLFWPLPPDIRLLEGFELFRDQYDKTDLNIFEIVLPKLNQENRTLTLFLVGICLACTVKKIPWSHRFRCCKKSQKVKGLFSSISPKQQ